MGEFVINRVLFLIGNPEMGALNPILRHWNAMFREHLLGLHQGMAHQADGEAGILACGVRDQVECLQATFQQNSKATQFWASHALEGLCQTHVARTTELGAIHCINCQ